MENYFCDRHNRNEKNLLLDDDNAILLNNDCNKCSQTNRLNITTGNLFNIESVRWQGKTRPNPVFVTNGTESRISLNSGDSVDAPLLLNVC